MDVKGKKPHFLYKKTPNFNNGNYDVLVYDIGSVIDGQKMSTNFNMWLKSIILRNLGFSGMA